MTLFGFPHIIFRKQWELTPECLYRLGQCKTYIDAISGLPLEPETRKNLLQVSLIKGAQATTAIEGNTLNEEEILKIRKGIALPPGKRYQEQEVKNVIGALNKLLEEVVGGDFADPISPELIKRFHRMIGSHLGEPFAAIPGKFRQNNVVVNRYKAPDHHDVDSLVSALCDWLGREFNFGEEQRFRDAVIEAVVAHVYIAWIHPFGDGNGRTARLLEFYILLRSGFPVITSHILSNHYNLTRPEYYGHIEKSTHTGDLTDFINYAVTGLRDGLNSHFQSVRETQINVFWENYIYKKFRDLHYKKKQVFKRKREVILAMKPGKTYSLNEIRYLSPQIAEKYSGKTNITVKRDLQELVSLELVQTLDGGKWALNLNDLILSVPERRAI